jgi:hypothetical protein
MNPEQKAAIRHLLAELRGERENITQVLIPSVNEERATLLEQKQVYQARRDEINILIEILKESIEEGK